MPSFGLGRRKSIFFYFHAFQWQQVDEVRKLLQRFELEIVDMIVGKLEARKDGQYLSFDGISVTTKWITGHKFSEINLKFSDLVINLFDNPLEELMERKKLVLPCWMKIDCVVEKLNSKSDRKLFVLSDEDLLSPVVKEQDQGDIVVVKAIAFKIKNLFSMEYSIGCMQLKRNMSIHRVVFTPIKTIDITKKLEGLQFMENCYDIVYFHDDIEDKIQSNPFWLSIIKQFYKQNLLLNDMIFNDIQQEELLVEEQLLYDFPFYINYNAYKLCGIETTVPRFQNVHESIMFFCKSQFFSDLILWMGTNRNDLQRWIIERKHVDWEQNTYEVLRLDDIREKFSEILFWRESRIRQYNVKKEEDRKNALPLFAEDINIGLLSGGTGSFIFYCQKCGKKNEIIETFDEKNDCFSLNYCLWCDENPTTNFEGIKTDFENNLKEDVEHQTKCPKTDYMQCQLLFYGKLFNVRQMLDRMHPNARQRQMTRDGFSETKRKYFALKEIVDREIKKHRSV